MGLNKRAALWLAAVVLSPVSGSSSAADSAVAKRVFDTQLEELLKCANENNPSLAAAHLKSMAAESASAGKRSLEPPLVGIEFYNSPVASFPDPLKNQGEIDYSVQQMFPFPGKLSSMAAVEKKRGEMFDMDRQTLELDIARDLKLAFFEIYLICRKLEINAETRDLVKSFIVIAQKQYELGLGKQSDILRAQTELSTLESDVIVYNQNKKSMEAMINTLRNKPVDSALPVIPEIDPPAVSFSLERLLPLALKSRPELKSMAVAVAMQKSEERAARLDYYPDFMVRGTYKRMPMAGDDWALMLGMTVPVAPWSLKKFASETVRARSSSLQADYEYRSMKNMVFSQVQDALSKAESARDRITLYKFTVIPQASQTLQSVTAAYQTGKQDFLMLIDAERMLLMAKLDYHMSVMNLFSSMAQLERAVGMSVPEIRQSNSGGIK